MKFKNKNILITGASSGIGFELAKLFADAECNLFLLARRVEKLKFFEDKTLKSTIYTIYCDVTSKESVEEAYLKIKEKTSHIDLSILNSGVSGRASVKEYNSSVAEEIFKTNVLGIVYFAELLIPDLIKEGSGIIAGVSSLADKRGFSKSGFYCASKAAATLVLESLRIELKPYGVKVITIKPGFVRTPMTGKNKFKMPLLIEASQAAQIIFKGLQKEKSIIEFPLMTALGSKLLRLIPDFIFDVISRRQQ